VITSEAFNMTILSVPLLSSQLLKNFLDGVRLRPELLVVVSESRQSEFSTGPLFVLFVKFLFEISGVKLTLFEVELGQVGAVDWLDKEIGEWGKFNCRFILR